MVTVTGVGARPSAARPERGGPGRRGESGPGGGERAARGAECYREEQSGEAERSHGQGPPRVLGSLPAPGSSGCPSGCESCIAPRLPAACGSEAGAVRRMAGWAGVPVTPVADELANAAARGDLQRLKELLDDAADPNTVNSYGRTPIQVMMLGSPRVAELLLQFGADPNRPDPSTGCFPIHDAARSGFLETVAVLHRAGARLDLPDGRGRLPLDVAVGGPHGPVGCYLRHPPSLPVHPPPPGRGPSLIYCPPEGDMKPKSAQAL
ncbi:ankyrin repeat domain-containing protein 54-like [Dryobates pubescens]|uniref:ankyrin repeat domain-containing protein 54-like n=1 Tax=Dryobates pubescens TaxID=118200 RepID=UPI0023BA0BB7|nr:ankyrin repeat domain-containing protein 54-like [Dryobates pubescens]